MMNTKHLLELFVTTLDIFTSIKLKIMAKFCYTFEDWVEECEKRGLEVERCKCDSVCSEPTGCLNGRSKALNNGQVISIFKHFINYGVFYD